jgi:hypothetical protein
MALSDTLTNVANRHRSIALAFINASQETIEVKVPAPRTTKSGAALFGDLAASNGAPQTKGPFKCLWHDVTTASTSYNNVSMQVIGRYPTATAFVLVALSDVLVTSTSPYGETWLDKADCVTHRGQKYEVLGVERAGMAQTAPYMLRIVLAGEVRRRA